MASSASPEIAKRQVGLFGGRFFVAVLESQIGQLLVRFVQLRIQIGGLLSRFHGVLAETFGFYVRDTEVRLGVVRVDLHGLFKQAVGFFVVEALQEQMAPADPVIGVLGILFHRLAELVVGFLIAFDAPESLGAKVRSWRLAVKLA